MSKKTPRSSRSDYFWASLRFSYSANRFLRKRVARSDGSASCSDIAAPFVEISMDIGPLYLWKLLILLIGLCHIPIVESTLQT